VVRRLSGTNVADAASGFRAFGRDAALKLNVMSDFTYTLETLVQAGTTDLELTGVTVHSRPVRRRSRLFRSIPAYLRRRAATLVRISALYRPARIFLALAFLFLAPAALLLGRFLFFYLRDPSYSGHTQSLVIASILFTIGFLLVMSGLVAYLVSINRRLLEEVLVRVKRLEMRKTYVPPRVSDATRSGVEGPYLPYMSANNDGNGHRRGHGAAGAGGTRTG
jgi:hypothetical protein